MIIVICKLFKDDKTGRGELGVDHAMDADTLEPVIVPCGHPHSIGAVFDFKIGEYVIYTNKNEIIPASERRWS